MMWYIWVGCFIFMAGLLAIALIDFVEWLRKVLEREED